MTTTYSNIAWASGVQGLREMHSRFLSEISDAIRRIKLSSNPPADASTRIALTKAATMDILDYAVKQYDEAFRFKPGDLVHESNGDSMRIYVVKRLYFTVSDCSDMVTFSKLLLEGCSGPFVADACKYSPFTLPNRFHVTLDPAPDKLNMINTPKEEK